MFKLGNQGVDGFDGFRGFRFWQTNGGQTFHHNRFQIVFEHAGLQRVDAHMNDGVRLVLPDVLAGEFAGARFFGDGHGIFKIEHQRIGTVGRGFFQHIGAIGRHDQQAAGSAHNVLS